MLALIRERPPSVQGCLSSFATPDTAARRRFPLSGSEALMPPYVRDACTIQRCDAFRRLAGKPAVISFPTNAHLNSRLSHVLRVVSVARTIGSMLGLNVSLCEAGAYGHDLGHVPFGHYGERILYGEREPRFRHELFGPVVAQCVEQGGKGLNLSHQTLVCMRDHSRGEGDLKTNGHLPEADAIMFADKFAYVFDDAHDFFDRAARNGVRFPLGEHPALWRRLRWFGRTPEERILKCVLALCEESAEAGRIAFRDSETAHAFETLRRQMYSELYETAEVERFERPPVPHLEDGVDIARMITDVKFALEEEEPSIDPALLVALMTDADVALLWECFQKGHATAQLVLPGFGLTPTIRQVMRGMSISDIIPSLRGRRVEMDDPDLDW